MGNRKLNAQQLLTMADEYATIHSGCTKVAVGSVITDIEGNILSFGANATVPDLCKTRGCLRIEKYGNNAKLHRLPADCRAVHSEIDAIAHCTYGTPYVIFVTRYPCEACARAIVAAGIKAVYYGRKQLISKETAYIFEYNHVSVTQVDWNSGINGDTNA